MSKFEKKQIIRKHKNEEILNILNDKNFRLIINNIAI